MVAFIGLTMISSSNVFAYKNHVALTLSFVNVPGFNKVLRSEIFINEDRQLQAAHSILEYEPLSRTFQDTSQAIRAGDPRLNCIDVSKPGFLARRDLPPVVLPLQQVFLEAAAAPREEVTSSHLSLKVKINKFHFEEGEIQETPLVNISNAEEEANRHSGVHLPTLVVAHLDSTSEEEEDEMALNRRNRSLRDLMAARNKGTTSQEVLKSQVPPTLPPPPPSLPTDLRLKAIPNLKKKRPIQNLEEREVGPQKGKKQMKVAKDARDKRSNSVDNREEQTRADVRLPQCT